MIKLVKVEDLRPGMYIHDLNCAWTEHDFLLSRFTLRSMHEVETLNRHPTGFVYIDTEKGLDLSYEAPPAGQALICANSHQDELPIARAVRLEACEVATSLMQDVRLGRQVDAERVEPVVGRITDSILRNSGTLVSLCRLKEVDSYTFQHSVSVATLMVAFGRSIGMKRDELVEAGIGGMLHDVGKMKVPVHILNKPGKHSEQESAVMRAHVEYGVDLLLGSPGITEKMLHIVGEHHERFNGLGYPRGLSEAAISPLGRMASIVDVYDAMTSTRVYKTGMDPMAAIQKMYGWSAQHFDPEMVQQFIKAIGIYPVGSLVRLASGRLAVVLEQGEAGLLYPVVRIVYDTKIHKELRYVDVDLGKPDVEGDRILDEENPFHWGIDPYKVMEL